MHGHNIIINFVLIRLYVLITSGTKRESDLEDKVQQLKSMGFDAVSICHFCIK